MREFIIKKLGGYHDKDSFLESLSEQDRELVLNEAVKKLFNTIDENDIFKLNEDGQVTFEGVPQTKEQVEALRNEARGFVESKLFRVLDKELKYQANIRLRKKSETALDITAAKLIEWVWDAVKNRMKHI